MYVKRTYPRCLAIIRNRKKGIANWDFGGIYETGGRVALRKVELVVNNS
jgi:hypothetical protein